MMRAVLIILSVLSLFMLPWQVTLVVGFAAALYVPIVALVLGVAAEMLYGAGTLPYALFAGVLVTFVALAVRRFMKARIMGL